MRENLIRITDNCLKISGIPVVLEKLVKYFNALLFYQTMPETVSGLVVKSPVKKERYCIVVNTRLPKTHIRFTIAHEIWHVLNKKEGITYCWHDVFVSPEERNANIFATELLMPKNAVLDCYYRKKWRDVDLYCDFFQVSRKAMEIRLFSELHLPIEDFYPF